MNIEPLPPPFPDGAEFVRVAYFNPADGRIVCRYSGPRHGVLLNQPHGCLAAEVSPEIDPATHRVNPATRTVERRPQQDIDAEQAQAAAAEAAASVKRQIVDLEQKQARALREHTIGRGGTPAELRKRLEDIDDQITALRAQLNQT
jgi:hypothetical protein